MADASINPTKTRHIVQPILITKQPKKRWLKTESVVSHTTVTNITLEPDTAIEQLPGVQKQMGVTGAKPNVIL